MDIIIISAYRYNNISANECANLLTLLNDTKYYADSVGSDQFFYLDTSAAADNQNFAQFALDGNAQNIDGIPPNSNYNEGFTKRKN